MLNKAVIIGRLGKDPEIKQLANGNKVCNFSVATSESYKNKAGEKVENTEWHNVVVWNPHLIKIVESYISKGTLIYIEGKIKTRKWEDKNGNAHYNTEIVIENFGGEIKILSSKNEGLKEYKTDAETFHETNYEQDKGNVYGNQQDDEEDDSLPF